MPKARHVMELQGRTRVVVENGKVIEVCVPMTEYGPIFDKVRGIRKFTGDLRWEAAGGVVLDPGKAAIDQVRGVKKAVELGYRKIGVS